MSIDLQNPTYWRCVNARQWQHAAAIRGCTIDRVMQDHGGYSEPKPAQVAEPVVVMRPRLKPKNVVVTPAAELSHAQKQAWKQQVRARVAAANVTPAILAEATGYTIATCTCSFSPSSEARVEFMRRVDAALDMLEKANLPPLEKSIRITVDWAVEVRRRRRQQGVTWEALAAASGYSVGAVGVACRAGWGMPPSKKAAIEALLGMEPAAEGGAA